VLFISAAAAVPIWMMSTPHHSHPRARFPR
jgi:hypothetical protein